MVIGVDNSVGRNRFEIMQIAVRKTTGAHSDRDSVTPMVPRVGSSFKRPAASQAQRHRVDGTHIQIFPL